MATNSEPRGDDMNANWINDEHIKAFAKALEAEDELSDGEISGISSPVSPLHSKHPRIRKISALSDFAPISQRVKRRRRGKPKPQREFIFHLVRWPLLFLILMVIFGQFGLYVAIRQIVNAMEWLFAWRGRKGVLRKKLRSAKTYEEWKAAAHVLDEYLDFNTWKREDEDPFYDYLLVKKVRRSLRSLREKNDVRGVMGVLEVCVRANFAGTESARLYSETFYGTKRLIESYLDEVESAMDYVRKSTELSLEEKRRFFRSTNRNLGASALCLSGGASFGYYHFGVVKALLDANLLPRVIAGTSCGSLIAAFVCTRTDAELKKLLQPQLADNITACEESIAVWLLRFLRTGARFDTVDWAKKAAFFCRGSLTFREAYALTGRVLNVSVIPFDRHSPTKLLNYLTAPDCVIWSAIIASAAVPGILNPVVLMQKTRSGAIVPWNWGSRFKDGSLRVDVPLQSLNLLFNVNHPVVSQVNPHVHLFFFASKGSAGRPVAHRKGKGWRGGFLLSAAEQFLKHELTKNFKVIRDLELMPQLLGQDWSSVFLQRFDGTVTIIPRSTVSDWIHILDDPSPADLERMMLVGQRATWPKLHMIENRFRLEKKILRGRQAVRRATLQRTEKPTQDTTANASTTTTLHNDEQSAHHGDISSVSGPSKKPFILFTDPNDQLPVESDAEASFAAGSDRFFKKSHGSQFQLPGSSGDRSLAPGQSSPTSIRRRRWGSISNTAVGSSKPRGKIPDAFVNDAEETQEGATQRPGHQRTPSFLQRLRSASFGSLVSPFTTRRGQTTPGRETDRASLASGLADERWSSDSSSEDELVWNEQMEVDFGHRSSLVMKMGDNDLAQGEELDVDLEGVQPGGGLEEDLDDEEAEDEKRWRAASEMGGMGGNVEGHATRADAAIGLPDGSD